MHIITPAGEGQRHRFVSRQRAYPGVNLAGVSLSGMTKNRQAFGPGLPVGGTYAPYVVPAMMTMAKALTNAAQRMGAIATLDIFEKENLIERSADFFSYFLEQVFSLSDIEMIIDI